MSLKLKIDNKTQSGNEEVYRTSDKNLNDFLMPPKVSQDLFHAIHMLIILPIH